MLTNMAIARVWYSGGGVIGADNKIGSGDGQKTTRDSGAYSKGPDGKHPIWQSAR
jgi:hypothetical protein